jgi:hypothetical protein
MLSSPRRRQRAYCEPIHPQRRPGHTDSLVLTESQLDFQTSLVSDFGTGIGGRPHHLTAAVDPGKQFVALGT